MDDKEEFRAAASAKLAGLRQKFLEEASSPDEMLAMLTKIDAIENILTGNDQVDHDHEHAAPGGDHDHDKE